MTNLNHAYNYNFMNSLNDCAEQSFASACTFNFKNIVLHTALVVCIFSALISLISAVLINVVSVINIISVVTVIIILNGNYLLYKQHLRL